MAEKLLTGRTGPKASKTKQIPIVTSFIQNKTKEKCANLEGCKFRLTFKMNKRAVIFFFYFFFTLKASFMTAADDKFFDIFPYF